MFTANVSNAELQDWAWGQAQVREGVAALLGRLSQGQTFAISAPLTLPLTAKEVWLTKAGRYSHMNALGLTNATAVAFLSALKADLDATYVNGYL